MGCRLGAEEEGDEGLETLGVGVAEESVILTDALRLVDKRL